MVGAIQNQPSSALNGGIDDSSQNNATQQSLQFLEQLLQMIQSLLQQMQSPDDDDSSPSVGSGSSVPSTGQSAMPQTLAQTPAPAAAGATPSTSASTPATSAAQPTPAAAEPATQASSVTATPSSGGDMTPAQVASTYKDQIMSASQATGVPPGIIAGQIWQESKGIANTPGGGLMQLGPNEFQQYGGGDISNPADNINAGANYMKSLSSQFGGNMGAALRAYNSGPNGVDVNNLNSTPAGTGDPTYVQKVMQAAQESGLATT